MKAVTFQGPYKVEVREVPDPKLEQPTDVVLRVTTASICGSDLHVYNGRIPLPMTGWTLGHEYVGVVEEVGDSVTCYKPGDRVVGAFVASCGGCFYCRADWPNLCLKQNTFGYVTLPGAQAQLLRVPFGDFTLERVPEDVPDEKAIFVGDCLATGYFCAERGIIRPGDVVAVVGCGSVGLFCVMSAALFNPSTIVAIDTYPERLSLASSIGAVAVNIKEGDPGAVIRGRTEGRGADVVLEAVGHADALRSCFNYVRPGGTISACGAYSEAEFSFPMFQAFLRDLTFKTGICPAKNYMKRLISLTQMGSIDPSMVVSHTLPLAEAAAGYEMFANRTDGCTKVLLKP